MTGLVEMVRLSACISTAAALAATPVLATGDPAINSPANGVQRKKFVKPARATFTFEGFNAIAARMRGQRFNADAQFSGDS